MISFTSSTWSPCSNHRSWSAEPHIHKLFINVHVIWWSSPHDQLPVHTYIHTYSYISRLYQLPLSPEISHETLEVKEKVQKEKQEFPIPQSSMFRSLKVVKWWNFWIQELANLVKKKTLAAAVELLVVVKFLCSFKITTWDENFAANWFVGVNEDEEEEEEEEEQQQQQQQQGWWSSSWPAWWSGDLRFSVDVCLKSPGSVL